MAEHNPEGPFGDLGLATYDDGVQEWHFTRGHRNRYILVAAIDDTPSEGRPSRAEKGRVGSNQGRQMQKVMAAHPELRPAEAILPSLLRVSSTVTRTIERFDFVIGSRLSFGYLYDYGQNRSAIIAAWVSDSLGSSFTVAKLRQQHQGWHDSKNAWLNVPVPSGYTATWSGPGTPIQQLILARTTEVDGVAPFLAARLLDRIVIFQLVLTRDGLHMLAVHEIGQETTPTCPIDVTFNPWYFRQYATIDMTGNWRVWQLEGRTDLEPTMVALHNALVEADPEVPHDGWRKIAWVGSPNMLVTCSRTDMKLYNIGDGVVWLQDIHAQLHKVEGWILDVTVLPELPSVLFVLTGLHLLVFEVVETPDEVVVRRILTLRHHFSLNDLTVRLRIYADGDGVVVLLLSGLSHNGLCYRFVDLTDTTLIITGPAAVDALAPILNDPATDLVVLPVQSGQSELHALQSLIDIHDQHTSATYQILYLKHGYELGQQLVCALSEENTYLFRPPEWKLRVRNNLPNATINEDWIDQEDEVTRQQRPISRFVKRLQLFPQNREGEQWTIDLSMTVKRLASQGNKSMPDMGQTLEVVEKILEAGTTDDVLPCRLLQHLQEECTVHDIDEADGILSRLTSLYTSHEDVNSVDAQPRLIATKLPVPQLDAIQQPAGLSSNYDHIINSWIRPLSQHISGRIRLAMEKLARQLAAEVTLASYVLRTEQRQPEIAKGQEEGELPTYQLDLPFRNVPMTAYARADGANNTGASTLPTPSPTATPSILTHASQASAYAPQKYHITNVTTFSKSLPISLPRCTQRVLHHWEVGADLATYDWRSYSQRITRQTEIEDLDTQLTEQERLRLQRKAERLLQRGRKEAAATRQQQALSSQLPELVVSASQPVEHTNASSYSQPAGAQLDINGSQSQPIAASQAVQGRYGNRPTKKKRKQGF